MPRNEISCGRNGECCYEGGIAAAALLLACTGTAVADPSIQVHSADGVVAKLTRIVINPKYDGISFDSAVLTLDRAPKGDGCARPNHPAIYARVDAINSWVAKEILR